MLCPFHFGLSYGDGQASDESYALKAERREVGLSFVRNGFIVLRGGQT